MGTSNEKVAFWQRHVAGYRNSELTQNEYAAKNNLSAGKLKYHLYRNSDKAPASKASPSSSPSAMFKKIPLSLPSSPKHDLRINLPNGTSLSFPAAIRPADLKAVLNVIGGL